MHEAQEWLHEAEGAIVHVLATLARTPRAESTPTSASRLGGGTCNVSVTGPDHSALLTDPEVFRLVRDAIDGKPCTGVVVP